MSVAGGGTAAAAARHGGGMTADMTTTTRRTQVRPTTASLSKVVLAEEDEVQCGGGADPADPADGGPTFLGPCCVERAASLDDLFLIYVRVSRESEKKETDGSFVTQALQFQSLTISDKLCSNKKCRELKGRQLLGASPNNVGCASESSHCVQCTCSSWYWKKNVSCARCTPNMWSSPSLFPHV